MVEEVRQGFPGFAWWNSVLSERSLKHRARPALATAVLTFAVLEAILFSRVLSFLPAYPSVILALFVWMIAPGWLPQRALIVSRGATLVEQFAFAFLISMALAAPAGLLGLQAHWSLDTFATLYALTAAAATGLAMLWQPGAADDIEPARPDGGLPVALLALALGAIVVAILTAPAWGDDISRDADDLVYGAYVNHYVSHDSLDASQLFSGARQGAFGRMSVNVWVVGQALLADQADVQAMDLLQTYLPPLMTVLAVAAAFALAKGLFRNTSVGLLAGLIMLAYGSLDLSPHEGFGRNIYLRIAEDKMAASFVLLPIAVLLASRFIEKPHWRRYLAVHAAIVGLAAVHPMSVVFFGVAFVSVAVFRALAERSISPLRSGALLGLPWLLPALAFLAVSGFGDSGRVLGDELQFRRQFHLNDLSGGLVVGNFHMIVHPLVLLALLAAPLFWLRNRRDAGAQTAFALVTGVLVVFFVPFVATPMSKVVSEQGVWRLPWLLPVPAVLAYGCYDVASRLSASRARAIVAFGLALVVTGGALVAQDLFLRADDGDFYNRTSSTSIVPGADGSVVIGGIDRTFARDWRPSPGIAEVLGYLRERVPPGSTVLAPAPIGRFFPAALDDIHPVDEFGATEPLERLALVNGFYDNNLRGDDLASRLDALGVTYVVVGGATGGEEAVQALGGAAIEPFAPSLAFSIGGFSPRQGETELADRGSSGNQRFAWSFDASTLEELRSPEFAALAGNTSALLEIAPAADVTVDATARFVVTVERMEDGQPVDDTQAHTVFDTLLPAGTAAGETVVRLRSLPSMTLGATYRVRVWRDGESALDTYPQDAWLLGLKFIAATADQPDEYHVYRYGPDVELPIASVELIDYDAVAGLAPSGVDALRQLRESVPAGAVVLAPPSIGAAFYDAFAGIQPVDDLLAADLAERRKFVAAFYNNALSTADVEAGLRRYGVTHALLSAGTEDVAFLLLPDTQEEPIASASVDAFEPTQGSPDLAPRDGPGGQFQAWAFDPAVREMLRGPTFTVSEEMAGSVGIAAPIAPASQVPANGGTVRLVVTLDRLEGGKPVGQPINTVFDVDLGPGLATGVRRARVRPVTLAPGQYAVRVWRDGGNDIDTYPADLWFAGVTIAPKSYAVFEVR